MIYSLESFETFINLIYVFLPVITLDTYKKRAIYHRSFCFFCGWCSKDFIFSILVSLSERRILSEGQAVCATLSFQVTNWLEVFKWCRCKGNNVLIINKIWFVNLQLLGSKHPGEGRIDFIRQMSPFNTSWPILYFTIAARPWNDLRCV